MTRIHEHEPGSFCWAEVATSDPAAAKRFYSELFNWKADDIEGGALGTYTLLKQGGEDVAGLRALRAQAARVPAGKAPAAGELEDAAPAWLPHVATADLEASVELASRLGGELLEGPLDVGRAGRRAALRDPTGARLGLWAGGRLRGAGVVGEPGSTCWFELTTGDPDGAARFYGELFGWTFAERRSAGSSYGQFLHGEHPRAGLVVQSDDFRPHWMVFFAVDDCEASARRAQKLGGRILSEPREVESSGRYAVLADPAGAAFALLHAKESGERRRVASPRGVR